MFKRAYTRQLEGGGQRALCEAWVRCGTKRVCASIHAVPASPIMRLLASLPVPPWNAVSLKVSTFKGTPRRTSCRFEREDGTAQDQHDCEVKVWPVLEMAAAEGETVAGKKGERKGGKRERGEAKGAGAGDGAPLPATKRRREGGAEAAGMEVDAAGAGPGAGTAAPPAAAGGGGAAAEAAGGGGESDGAGSKEGRERFKTEEERRAINEARDQATVFVKHIAPSATEADVTALFSGCVYCIEGRAGECLIETLLVTPCHRRVWQFDTERSTCRHLAGCRASRRSE